MGTVVFSCHNLNHDEIGGFIGGSHLSSLFKKRSQTLFCFHILNHLYPNHSFNMLFNIWYHSCMWRKKKKKNLSLLQDWNQVSMSQRQNHRERANSYYTG